MNRSLLAATALAVAVAACRPAAGEPAAAAPLSAEDIAAIRATDSAFAGAANAGDAARMASAYLADAHLMPPNAAGIVGPEAIQRFWAGLTGAYDVTIDVVADEIDGRGDLAYARGHYTLEGKPKADAPPMHDQGKFLEVLRRQRDGSWRYAIDMYSSDLPAAAPGR